MPKKINEKKDLSMEDEEWNSRVEDVETFLAHAGNQAFLSSDETIEDGVELIRMNIRRGNRNPAKRKTFWKQILDEGREWKKEHGADVEMDWPTSQGKPSTLPPHVQQSTTDIYNMTFDASIDYWNNNQIVQITSIRSGRNKEEGGQPYADAEEYAKTRAFAMKQRFVKLFNDGRWDGNYSLEDGMTISLPPATENGEGDEDASDDA